METTNQSDLRKWLHEALEKEGRGARARLAKYMNLKPDQVTRMSNVEPGQQVRDIKAHEWAAIRRFFGLETVGVTVPSDPGEIVETTTPYTTALVAGTVEAGAFRLVDDLAYDQDDAPEMLVPRDPDFPNAKVVIFEVSGDSMDDLKPMPILPGAHAVCLDYADVAHRYPLRDDLIVVVQRTRDGGHLREWSIKQLKIFEDRMEFHPHSKNRRHVPIVVMRDSDADDGTTVEIIALTRYVINKVQML